VREYQYLLVQELELANCFVLVGKAIELVQVQPMGQAQQTLWYYMQIALGIS
jgi:hypothetical protein